MVIPVLFCACGGNGESQSKSKEEKEESTDMSDYEVPSYVFDHTPTADEMRQMAVKAMRDMLSVKWKTPEDFAYYKTGAAADKHYVFSAGTQYAGLPYTDINRSYFGFLEYYDAKTGMIKVDEIKKGQPDLGTAVNAVIGNTCTGATGWATMAVCNSVGGTMGSFTLTYEHGFIPVGDYVCDNKVNSLDEFTTRRMCEETGRDKMYECYAITKPADLVVMQNEDRSSGHSMMVIDVVTERDANGKIIPDCSYITIQDQHVGFYSYDDPDQPGTKISYIGHIARRYTFPQMFDAMFVPVTTAEYLGTKAYEPPKVEVSVKDIKSVTEMANAEIKCNYPMAVIRVVIKGADGSRNIIKRQINERVSIGERTAFSYKLSTARQTILSEISRGGVKPGDEILVEVIPSTGSLFTPVSFIYQEQ